MTKIMDLQESGQRWIGIKYIIGNGVWSVIEPTNYVK
jgi:hypothetical protein